MKSFWRRINKITNSKTIVITSEENQQICFKFLHTKFDWVFLKAPSNYKKFLECPRKFINPSHCSSFFCFVFSRNELKYTFCNEKTNFLKGRTLLYLLYTHVLNPIVFIDIVGKCLKTYNFLFLSREKPENLTTNPISYKV